MPLNLYNVFPTNIFPNLEYSGPSELERILSRRLSYKEKNELLALFKTNPPVQSQRNLRIFSDGLDENSVVALENVKSCITNIFNAYSSSGAENFKQWFSSLRRRINSLQKTISKFLELFKDFEFLDDNSKHQINQILGNGS